MPLLTPNSESESGHLGLSKRGFHVKGVVKIIFSQKSEFACSWDRFWLFSFSGLGFNFDDFRCFEDRLKIEWFYIAGQGGTKARWNLKMEIWGCYLSAFWIPLKQPDSIAADSMQRQLGNRQHEIQGYRKDCLIILAGWCPSKEGSADAGAGIGTLGET